MMIRTSQIEVFEQNANFQFEQFAVPHFQKLFPETCDRVGEPVLRQVIRLGLTRARSRGFSSYRSLCIYITLMFWLGAHWDEDLCFGWAQEILHRARIPDQELRATRLQQAALHFLNAAEGTHNEHLEAALERASRSEMSAILPHASEPFGPYIAAQLKNLHPAKCQACGEKDLLHFVEQAYTSAGEFHLHSHRQAGVYAGAAFFLGIGFAFDPLHSWVHQMLITPEDTSPDITANRLFQACRAYIRAGRSRA
jgi:hypothetical protein